MAAKTTVKIARGRFSPQFQVARAMLSAASAVCHTDRRAASAYIEKAITELRKIQQLINQPS